MALWKSNKKNILINQIDVKYREIENFEYQYQVLSKILQAFEIKDLEKILKTCKKVQKIDEQDKKQYLEI
jgi:hypothetical protein